MGERRWTVRARRRNRVQPPKAAAGCRRPWGCRGGGVFVGGRNCGCLYIRHSPRLGTCAAAGVASSNGESNRSRPAQHGSPAQSRRVWLTSSLGLSGSSHSTPMTPMLAVHKPCPSHIRLCCTLPLAGSRIPNASLTSHASRALAARPPARILL